MKRSCLHQPPGAGEGTKLSQEYWESEELEMQLLIEGIYRKYGYDFRNYAKASLKRRIKQHLAKSNLDNISQLTHDILHHLSSFEKLLLDFSVSVTEMFRDPAFYLALREQVLPSFRKTPFIKVWHAGCATGEEVYSMAILLREEGLYERTQIYATDFNEVVLKKGRAGVYPISRIKSYTANYQKAGGRNSFADYYTARYDSVLMDRSLKKNIVFADHNLVTDWVFGEMDIIFCRNVLIYFDRKLQNRVFELFRESLKPGGVLCLGSKESVRFSDCSGFFEDLVGQQKIYRKKG